jgi:hypothetical protein
VGISLTYLAIHCAITKELFFNIYNNLYLKSVNIKNTGAIYTNTNMYYYVYINATGCPRKQGLFSTTTTTTTIIIIIIITQIKFNRRLLTRGLDSTRTQLQHENNTNSQNGIIIIIITVIQS